MTDYSTLDKLMHGLALGNRMAAETMFDIDQQISQANGEAIARERHVFVSGLARSGTTALLRGFHETGHFRSLQYSDMPFVLAPNLWKRVAGKTGPKDLHERAHGDSVMVNTESPECLDEVFWRIFCGADYIGRDRLRPHAPSGEEIAAFRNYVAAVLKSAHAPTQRYLSKNNNNILRLAAIRRAFPNAVIILPFRAPIAHAHSLWRQHKRFLDIHEQDPFALKYMQWLAHHEFGADHRPFRFHDGDEASRFSPLSLDYWLELWIHTYAWLRRNAPPDCTFISYEALCTDPHIWASLQELCGLPVDAPATPFRAPKRDYPQHCDATLLAQANAIHDQLTGMTGEDPLCARASAV